MIRYVVVDHLTKSQLNQIIILFKKNFPGNIKKLEKFFFIALKNTKSQKWILALLKNKICGALLLKFKTMNYQGTNLKVCGMSYMAVENKIQKSNVAKNIINLLIKNSKKYDLILGFARKKLDGYYVPYDFVGSTDFGTLTINTLYIKTYDPYSSVKIENIKEKNISKINKLYKLNDLFITGNFIRKQSDFKKHLINNSLFKSKVFKKDGIIIGYIVFKENIIYEIRVNPKYYFECSFSLKKYFLKKSFEQINFSTNLNDPFLRYLSKFSHQLSTRHTFEGGHIIRIVNIEKLLNKLKPMIKKKLLNLGINKLSLNYEGLIIIFKNKKLNYKFSKKININLITKLIFGIIPNNDQKLETLFGNTQTQFPILDHF